MNREEPGRGRVLAEPQVAAGWVLSRLTPASRLYGANGMQIGPDGRLYVAQAFGNQVSAVDLETGSLETICPPAGALVGPDDVAFDSLGTMYVTEVLNARVSARAPDGTMRVVAGELPSANGVTVHRDRLFIDEHRRGGRLFELYPDGSRPPRLICDDLFGPNALMAGPDGKLYFPLVPLGEVWRVDIETGTKEKVAEGLAAPPAVKFSPRGELIVPQARTGEIVRVDVQSGAKTVIARLRPGIDNLAFAPDGRMFVSHFIDGGVAEVATDGSDRVRPLVVPGFVGPWGLAWDGSAQVLHIGDGLSLATLRAGGEATRLGGILDEGFPGFIRGIAAGEPGELLISTVRGDVVRYRVAAAGTPGAFTTVVKRLEPLGGLARAGDAVVAVGTESGGLLRIDPSGHVERIASALDAPSDVVARGDGTFLVSEAGRGRVVAVDAGGRVSALAEGLTTPKGMVLHRGWLWVLDVGARSLGRIELETGTRQDVATGLPVGGVAPLEFPGGIAVDEDGTVFVAGSADGSVLALRSI